jgi:HEAT repeat protein
MPDASSAIAAQRRRAAALAGHMGDATTARDLLSDSAASVRATAFAALDRCAQLDEPTLLRGLADDHADVRRRCVALAARAHGDRVNARLLELLGDVDVFVAEAAAWALGEWAERATNAVGALAAMATDHVEPLCREAAVAALGAIGDARALPAILRACTDKPAVRRRAVLALAPFDGPDVEAAIDAALQDRDWQVRQAAEDLRR